jgi:tetratricopeptide (TPR) repeat protein
MRWIVLVVAVLVIAVLLMRGKRAPEAPSEVKARAPVKTATAVRPPARKVPDTPPVARPEAVGETPAAEEDRTAGTLSQVAEAVQRNRPEEARSLLEAALEKDPDNYELSAELGFVESRLFHNDKKAIASFEKALTANSENGQAMQELVTVYLRSDRTKEGFQFLDRLAEKYPDDHKIDLARAEMYAKRGDYPSAVAAAERATTRPKATSEAQDNLAYQYAKLGDADRARQHYEEFLRQNAAERSRAVREQGEAPKR